MVPADASITGSYPNQKLNLILPQGPIGPPGPANNLSVGTVEFAEGPLNDIIVADILQNGTESKKAFTSKTAIFNVKDFGAVADASDLTPGTNNTPAFQAAVDAAALQGGGIILIPAGQYHLAGAVMLKSNIHIIGYGAILRKFGESTEYSAFKAFSNGATGYGSSVRNVTFEGIHFRGQFGTGLSGISIGLHHAQNITFRKCEWFEAVVGGHAIDSSGSDGILVDNCVFRGFKPQTNREYVEAIQLDHSLIGGLGGDTLSSYDGLPTINVTVQNSKFLPYILNGTTYPAPNPMGSHGRVVGQWFNNIKFLNNYVEGCHEPVTTDPFALTCKGWLHFFCAQNVTIRGNYFKNTGAKTSRVIGAYPISTGTALADVGTAGAASISMTPMPIKHITIAENTFEGFSSDTAEGIIWLSGTSGTNGKDVKILNNTLFDSFSTPGVAADKGQDFIYLQDIDGSVVDNNDLDIARSLIYAFRCKKLQIFGGILRSLGAYIGRFSTCTDILIKNVHVDGHGGGYYFYTSTSGVEIDGGTILNGYPGSIFAQHISISGVTQFYIHGLRIPYNSSNGYTKVMSAYNTATKGKVKDLMVVGWDPTAIVGIGAGSDVVVTENIT